jgi:hypothetical protein
VRGTAGNRHDSTGLFTRLTRFAGLTRFERLTGLTRFAGFERLTGLTRFAGLTRLSIMRRLEKKSEGFLIRDIRNNIRNKKFVRFV